MTSKDIKKAIAMQATKIYSQGIVNDQQDTAIRILIDEVSRQKAVGRELRDYITRLLTVNEREQVDIERLLNITTLLENNQQCIIQRAKADRQKVCKHNWKEIQVVRKLQEKVPFGDVEYAYVSQQSCTECGLYQEVNVGFWRSLWIKWSGLKLES